MNATIPITSVTVHPDGAIVTRKGQLPVVGGQLSVRALPLALDEGSVRASVAGGALRALRVTLDLDDRNRPDATGAWRALRDAACVVERLEAERQLVISQRSALSELLPKGPSAFPKHTGAPGLAQLAAWGRLNGALEDWGAALDTHLGALDDQLREAREQRDIARSRLGNESSEAWWRRWFPTRVALIGVEATGVVEVTLSYRVPGAMWAPAYTLRADAELRSGALSVRALVAQVTGEDWRGVRLSLSTAPSARPIDLPELAALRLGTRQSPRPKAWRELPPGLDELFPPEDLSLARPAPVEALLPELGELTRPEPAPQVEITAATRPVPSKKRRRAREQEEIDVSESFDDEGAAAPEEPTYGSIPQPIAMPSGMINAAAPVMAGPPPAPMAKRSGAPLRTEMARQAVGGGGFAPPPPAPPPPELVNDALDYPRLRLRPYTDPRGVRGRLRGVSLADEAREAGLPAAGQARLQEQLSAMLDRIRGLGGRSLPPRHVLAGPLDGIDARYETEGAVDIPSDGQFHSLTVAREPARLQVLWRTVPREDPRVFRLVEVLVESRLALLPGPVEVYVGGAYTLTVDWRGAPRGARFRVGLGVEDRLKLARNVRYWEETAGLLRGSRRLHTEISVDIASSMSREVVVEILERLPQPGEDALKVELVRAEPEAKPYEGEPGQATLKGGRRQATVVAAGGLAKTVFHYSVTMDAALELQGGDRRG